MEFVQIIADRFDQLKPLLWGYKREIREAEPSEENLESLRQAIQKKQILFFGCTENERLIACCSISYTYSTFTFDYKAGVFEDFYILPEYRHQGIARKLVQYAISKSGVSSLIVGCTDCHLGMYNSLGFSSKIGNMLAFEI